MDKNTIIGLVLIAAIIFGYTIYTRPSDEQIAEQKRLQDSIQLVKTQKEMMEAERNNNATTQNNSGGIDTSSENVQNIAKSFFATGNNMAQQNDSSIVEMGNDSTISAQNSNLAKEQYVTLENEFIQLKLSTHGGNIHSVYLKGQTNYKGDSLFIFEGDEARFNLDLYNRNSVRLSTENQIFTPIKTDNGNSVIMRLASSQNQYIDLVYTLMPNDRMVNFDVRVVGMKNGLHPESLTNFKINWAQKIRQQEKGRQFENRYSRIYYKQDKQGVSKLSESKDDKKELTEPIKWFAFKDHFFSTIVIADKPFDNTIVSSDILESNDYIKGYKAETWAPITASPQKDELSASFKYYFGPNHFYTLKDYDKDVKDKNAKLDLENIVDLGYNWLSWINKYFSIPLFNFFLSLNWNMGIIILIMTLLIKLIISPLTYKSYMSSAKMRVLRPQVKEIEDKYPGQDKDVMLKRQQATMALYSKAGASPMSGCLPMLLQMPILLAFFFFFPSAIELRHHNFLWAADLSTYDSIISWNANIPFISKFMGNHISLFCLLMTVVNIIYTKYNMAATDTGQAQMPGMKMMPIFMSIFMFFFLNSYPSGLNYYYFLSTLFTIIITFSFKYFINEEKLLAKLEANKKKVKKKSGFMARLEEAQKIQQKQARENAKKRYK